MKLEVGMYVRTKDGIIDKVIIDYNGHCANPNCECKHISCAKNYYDEDKVVKASYNIIDILEVGDYVNGDKVIKIFNPMFLSIGELPYIITINGKYEEQEIETIVTHEQMERMTYKVEE